MKKKEQFNLALWDRLKKDNIPHSFVTRNEVIVNQITLFNVGDKQRIYGFDTEDNSIEWWSVSGYYMKNATESGIDLFIVWEEEQLMLEGWMNVLSDGGVIFWYTKEDADMDNIDRIACVKISIPYTKGEGLSEPTTN